jgi:hypothetical protein
MSEFRDTEEASDARHNTAQETNPFEGFISPEKWGRVVEAPPPFGQVLADAASKIEAFKDSELSFSFPHTGGVFTRMARSSVEDFGNLDLIDLRTLRAHLEEASFLVANAWAKLERQR